MSGIAGQESQGSEGAASRVGGVGEDALPVAFGQVQYLVAQFEFAYLWMAESFGSAGAEPNIMPCPQARELGAVHGKVTHQFSQAPVIGIVCGDIS